MVKEHINAADAYAPPWHFNQAVKVTEGTSMIFLSALAGYQPDGTLAESDVVAQAEAAFENMAKVVRAAEVVGCEQSSGTFVQVLGETADLRASFSTSVKRIEPLESGGCAKPDIAGGRYDPWAGDIAELAKSPNVVCKFSGLLNCAPPGADQDKLRPYADHVASYQRWHDVSRALLAGLAKKDRAMIFGGNTERIYRL